MAVLSTQHLFAMVQYTANPLGGGGFWNWSVWLGESAQDTNSCVIAEHLSAVTFLNGSGSNDVLYPECEHPTHMRDYAWRNIMRLAWRQNGGQSIFSDLADLETLIAALLAVFARKGLVRQNITIREHALQPPSEVAEETWCPEMWDARPI